MQKEILKPTGEDVETLYLAPLSSTKLNSSVNFGQRRWIFKSTRKSYAKTLLAASSSTFLTGVTCEGL